MRLEFFDVMFPCLACCFALLRRVADSNVLRFSSVGLCVFSAGTQELAGCFGMYVCFLQALGFACAVHCVLLVSGFSAGTKGELVVLACAHIFLQVPRS